MANSAILALLIGSKSSSLSSYQFAIFSRTGLEIETVSDKSPGLSSEKAFMCGARLANQFSTFSSRANVKLRASALHCASFEVFFVLVYLKWPGRQYS